MMKIESPKTRFLQTPQSKLHAEFVTHPAMIVALDAALAQMQYQQGTSNDMGTAAAKHFLLEGGRKFRDIFLMLSHKGDPVELRREDSLPNPEL